MPVTSADWHGDLKPFKRGYGTEADTEAGGRSMCIEHASYLRVWPVVYTMVILNICYRREEAFREPDQSVQLWVML